MRVVDCSTMPNYGEESHGFTHDVFVSFRGDDTRDNFTVHLLKKLQEKGINIFFDDENLRIGEGISPALLKAIEDSKISIIVFSQNYASSKWCLTELEKIMMCTEKTNKQLAFPIFYHVDPSEIRNQKNSYGKAMIDHEKWFGKESEKIQAWRSTLSKAGHLKGHHIHTGSEAKHIEEIVEKVCAHIAPKPLHVDEGLVGLKHPVEKVKSLLHMKDDYRCMLGIYGPGRVGKTELAKVLYNEIAHQFEAASFLANVRENSKKKGLEHLQKTLLSEMFEPLKAEFGSTCRGISEMKKRLQKKKVLLVLDDVDNSEQINELAGRADWFGFGSRIIITTRNKALLDSHKFEKFYYYKMTELNDQHSLELFSQKAFKKSHPERGYEDVSARAVGYAKGLPLAIKAIASSLSTKKNLKAWQDAMDDYERIPHNIQDLLRVNCDALEHYAQTAFLDIGCLSKGERKEYRNNIRPNRVTGSGFWKAPRIDKSIYCDEEYRDHECIGLKKSLVSFYGNAGKDTKTDWKMHEFRLPPNEKTSNNNPQHNGIDDVQQVKFLRSLLTVGTTKHSFECTFCKRDFPNFQALVGHTNIHKKDRAKAKANAKQVEFLHAGTTKRSYKCIFCKKGFPNFQALGGHRNIHRKDRAKAKVINNSSEVKESSLSFKPIPSHTKYTPNLRDSAAVVKKPNPTNSSSSTYYNQNSTGIWSKYGLDTCKFLLIFKNGEILDFQRLDNTDVIL